MFRRSRSLWTGAFFCQLHSQKVYSFLPNINRQPANPIKTSAKQMSSESGKALEKLRQFGYAFNAEGQLRKIDVKTGEAGSEPFQFDVFQDDAKNQEHYEQLANQIPEIVFDLLEQNGLSRTYIPKHLPPELATYIFTQPKVLTKPKKLLVLIHGSGYVRAGQWSRSLIINNSLDHGTQIPYIKRAQALGYDILVMNTNDNFRMVNGVEKGIPGVDTATTHARYVWRNIVLPAEPESVAIVAHSYGGSVTMDLAQHFSEFFKEKVFAIALTDSAHFNVTKKLEDTILEKTINWVSSNKPLNEHLRTPVGEIPRVSAGHTKHEWTSYTAFEGVFKYLEKRYKTF